MSPERNRRRFRSAVLVAAGLGISAWGPRTARAGDVDPAALFDRGLADMQAHRYAVACPELAESYRIDPHAGGLFTLAECENQAGKLASAITDYDGFLDLVAHLPPRERTRQEPRAKIAAEHRAALAREVPSLTVTLAPDVPAGSTVTIDGRAVPAGKLGTLLNEDPGEHVAVVEAPDGRKGEQHVSLAPRDSRAITVGLASVGSAPTPVVEKRANEDRDATWRAAALATGGVGAAVLIAGGVMGAIVLADKSSIDSNCPTSMTCGSSSEASSANGARTLGWASTGAFIGGGALLGAAAVLWLARPSRSASVEPVLSPAANGGVLGVRGVF